MALPKPASMIRIGAACVILGELIALATQLTIGADAFVMFIVGGGGLTVGGAVIALWGVLRSSSHPA